MGCPRGAPGAENARRRRSQFGSVLIAAAMTWLVGARPARAEAPAYETVVSAAPEEAAREDAAAASSVVTPDRTPRSGESLPQLLLELPGVHVTRTGSMGSLATVSVRGSSPNQVLVYVDGVPLQSAATGVVDLGQLPLGTGDRLEIYRGSSPLAFGASGMGGVVSLTSEAPRATGLAAYTGLGSFFTRSVGGELAWVGANLTLGGRVNTLASRADYPYLNDNGTLFDPGDDQRLRRQNNQLDHTDAQLRAELRLPGRRSLVAVGSALDRRQGLPSLGSVRSLQTSLATRRLLGSLAYASRDDLGPGGRLKITLYGLAAEQRLDDRLAEVAFAPTSTRDRSLTTGATTVAERAFGSRLRVAAMLEGRHERFSPSDALTTDQRPPGQRVFGAGGIETNVWFPALALDLLPSARIERAHDHVSPAMRLGSPAGASWGATYTLPILRLGLVQRPHRAVRLRANLGRYARLPTLSERYGNGGLIVGNPDLLPERGYNADVGATVDLGDADTGLSLDAGVFASRTRNLIHFQKGSYHARYRNVGQARILGTELGLSARLLRHGRLHAQATFTDARDSSGLSSSHGRQLPHRPRLRAYSRPELRDLPLGPLRLGLYGEVDVTGGNHADAANLVRFPARTMLGAGASVGLPRTGLRAVLSAYNLTDARVNDVIDFPLPGRSLFLTLHIDYPTRPDAMETMK